MIGRRPRPPILAEISGRSPEASRAWSLSRADLKAFDRLLGELGSSKAVLVTGAEAGRSAAAVGLATAATAAGIGTALLECDLRNPTLAAALGLAPAPGLAEYLRWEVEAKELLQPIALAGPASGRAISALICVVAGAPSVEGEMLLASQSFAHAVEKMRHAYELLVLLGAPLGRDARLLAEAAAVADTTLACIGRAETSGRAARAVASALGKLPAPPAGLVVFDR